MGNKSLLVIGVLALVWGFGVSVQAGPNTVDFYLTTPDQYKGLMINLDVKGVRPVEFKSPIPELAFFQMTTWDKQKNRPGGHIMLVAPATESTNIMRKYGDDMRRGGDVDRMRGLLILSPGGPEGPAPTDAPAPPQGHRPRGPHRQMWMIDYEGRCSAIIEAHKAEMERVPQIEKGPAPDNK